MVQLILCFFAFGLLFLQFLVLLLMQFDLLGVRVWGLFKLVFKVDFGLRQGGVLVGGLLPRLEVVSGQEGVGNVGVAAGLEADQLKAGQGVAQLIQAGVGGVVAFLSVQNACEYQVVLRKGVLGGADDAGCG